MPLKVLLHIPHTIPYQIIAILHLYFCPFWLQEMILLILLCAHLARGDPFISPTRTERSSLRQCQDHGIHTCNKVGWPFFQFEVAKNLKTLIFTDSRNRVVHFHDKNFSTPLNFSLAKIFFSKTKRIFFNSNWFSIFNSLIPKMGFEHEISVPHKNVKGQI